MARRLTEAQKNQIIESFNSGKTIDELSKKFNCTKLTICRNLKKKLGEENYENEVDKRKYDKTYLLNKKNHTEELENEPSPQDLELKKDNNQSLSFEANQDPTFMEIAPLDFQIDNQKRKDLSSVSIAEVEFPKIVYMIVDNKIELKTKKLGDYPSWQFLPENDLKRETIEIYDDLKIAKKYCSKEQRVIKVPNTDVFRIVAPILLSRGITRIVSSENLIAL